MADPKFDYESSVPDLLTAMAGVNAKIAHHDIAPKLRHLMELRASQLNACAYCVKLHLADARRDGEHDERLDRLVVWRHVENYTAEEKAAFAWTEALTRLDDSVDMEELRAELAQHFTAEQIGTLTAIVAQINVWNRIHRSLH